jgi:hypothetical protein
MQSSQPGSNDCFDRNEPDNPGAIPEWARAWELTGPKVASSVRRPSTLPDPQSYHEVIDPEAIFELDEEQKDGSIETIFVVPFACQRCKTLRQACSRTRPVCVRCRKDIPCVVVQEGYQKLPGPKVGKPSMMGKQRTSGTCDKSIASRSTQELTAGRPRVRRIASRVVAPPSNSGPSVAPGSKRPLSPGSDPVSPRKKAQAKTTSRKGEARCFTVAPPKEMEDECSEVSAMDPSAQVVSAVVSTGERSALKWTFVNRDEKSSRGEEHVHSVSSNTLIPRVWANVRLAQTVLIKGG